MRRVSRGSGARAIAAGGGGAVNSVNGQTGVVVLDADTIDESATRLWLTPAERDAIASTPYTVTAAELAGTPAENRLAIQAALTAAAPGDIVRIQPGTYQVDTATHPNATSGFGYCVFAIKTGVLFDVRGCIFILATGSTVNTASSETRFVTNWVMNDSADPDNDITILGGVFSGNASNVGVVLGTPYKVHGIQLWRVDRPRVIDTMVFDCHGTNTGSVENFHIDFNRCRDFVCRNTLVASTPAAPTGTGHSANYCEGGVFDGCVGAGMTNGHGFTVYASNHISYSQCRARSNGSKGFNLEHSWRVGYVACTAGGRAPYLVSTTGVHTTFTAGATQANAVGFHVLLNKGGGDVTFHGCETSHNTTGFTALGAVTDTATTGTTGSTIVMTTAGLVFEQMRGRYVSVNNGTPVLISSVNEATNTITTAAAHGGASGNTVMIFGGRIEWAGGSIKNNTTGVQFLDTGADVKRAQIAMTRFTRCEFIGNTNDMVDVGNGAAGVVTTIADLEALVQVPSASSAAWATTVTFRNPFPFDCQVAVISATGATTLGGFGGSMNSTGINSGMFPLPAGCRINVTSGTAPRFYPLL